jgi:flagellum-specific ATP synthase
MNMPIDFSRYFHLVDSIDPHVSLGTVTEMVGLLIESSGPVTSFGDFCEIRTKDGRSVRVQVIGFRNGRVLSMPLEEISGIQMGDKIVARPVSALMKAGPGLLGRVLDGFGEPMDGGPPIQAEALCDLFAVPPGPL